MTTYNTGMERLGYGLTLIGVFGGLGLFFVLFLVARFDGQWSWPEIATWAALLGAIGLAIAGVQMRKRSGAVVSPDLRPDGTPNPPRDKFRDVTLAGGAIVFGSILAMVALPESDRIFSLYLVAGLGLTGCGLWGKYRAGRR